MIVDLKPYPEYKESGLSWLGAIPASWSVNRAKSVFERLDKRSRTGREQLLTVSSARGIVPRNTANVTMFKAESYVGYKLCWPDDLVINSLWAWAGGLGVSKHHGIISSAYGVYRLRQDAPLVPAFVHDLVRSTPFNWELRVRSKGVWISRLQMTDIAFLDAPMFIPPREEQEAIVRFLDWTNGRLERAIRAKRKAITLLNEQKYAIVHHTVTAGLDLSIPRKSSGVPWLGDVPHNWDVTVAKRVCSVFVPQRDKPELNEVEGTPWITMEHIGGTFVKPSRFYVRNRDAGAVGSRTVPPGSVLASCVGRFGIASINTEPVIINQQIQAFIPTRRISKLFLLYSVLIAKPYFDMRGNSTTLPYVDREGFETMPLLIPPISEQEAIVLYLEKATAKADLSISRLEREINLLHEYRARLVADVVTGKLDVREVVSRLPDEMVPGVISEEDTDLVLETVDAGDFSE